ncbi:MAG: hypothetical protein CL916_06730, partial [Deltaproteobacteria bacterium]|nr:hypothetical protein [Deltaproteobacteria bacterium]
MLVALFLSAFALPISYFRSEKPRIWNPPQKSFFEEDYQRTHPIVSFPIIPFWGFGFRFDGDLMISLTNDNPWGMIEVAYVENKEGEKVWFTLDSRLDGRQYIGLSDHPLSDEIASLFPIPSYRSQLQVLEKDNRYTVSYMRGNEPISFSIPIEDGIYPPSAQNGHAMNHSQQDMMAILNISSLKLHRVQWLDTTPRTQSFLWQPISGVMSQTVAGLRRGVWTQTKSSVYNHPLENRFLESQECIQTAHIMYCFLKKEEERQLYSISLFQPLRGDEIASAVFSPALPDLRFIPQKNHCSDIFWNIENQEHAQGKVCVHPLRYGTSMVVSMHAPRPSWVNARPVLTSLTVNPEREEVYASSMILSDGAIETHDISVSVSDVIEIPVPKTFLWNGNDLISRTHRPKKKGRAYSVAIPLVPKDDILIGTVSVKSSFA